MSFIDYTYFVNKINIPSSGINVQTNITAAVALHEEIVLRALLGDSLYDAMIAGLAIGSPLQKWLDLRDGGVQFTVVVNGESIIKTWRGLKCGATKEGLIAFYVYCQYRLQNDTFYSGQNQIKSQNENSVPADAIGVYMQRWNDFIRMYGKVPYNDPYNPVANNFYDEEASAYNFLMANIANYPDWRFTPQQIINDLGI